METFGFNQGINKFGHKLYEATYGEMLHLYQRTRCKPIKVEDFNPRERKIAL